MEGKDMSENNDDVEWHLEIAGRWDDEMSRWEEKFHNAAMEYRAASVEDAPVAYAVLLELALRDKT